MAIQCKYCGTELPKEDARFCNNCGMLVPSHPFSPQSLSALKESNGTKFPFASAAEGRLGTEKLSRDDYAELDGATEEKGSVEVDMLATSALPPQEEKLPEKASEAVAEKLPETPNPELQAKAASSSGVAYRQMTPLVSPRRIPGVRRKISGPIQLSPVESAWPEAATYAAAKEVAEPEKERVAKENDNAAGKREFHVGVWEDQEMRGLTDKEQQSIESLPTRSIAAMPVEDAPTRAVGVPVEDAPTRAVGVPVEEPLPSLRQSIEQVSPNPYLSVPSSQTVAQGKLEEDWRVRSRIASGPVDPSILSMQPNAPFVPSAGYTYTPAYMPGAFPGEQGRVGSAPPPSNVRQSGKRWPVVVLIAVVLIAVLGAGGVGALMMQSQQSTQNPVVQAQVSFSDTQLGISLLYPNGWIKQVEAAKSIAHFYASGHIGEVDVSVAPGSGTVKQALQQQATTMGLSGTKAGASLHFAGESWQQLQGTLQQSGVSYTDTLLATVHGGKLFMLVQQAPQNDYADWAKEFFTPLCASFKFL